MPSAISHLLGLWHHPPICCLVFSQLEILFEDSETKVIEREAGGLTQMFSQAGRGRVQKGHDTNLYWTAKKESELKVNRIRMARLCRKK